VIPSDAPDEFESARLRKALHFLAELGAVVASSTQLQTILDWVVSKTAGMLQADEGCLRLIEAHSATSQTIIRPKSHQLASGSRPRAWRCASPATCCTAMVTSPRPTSSPTTASRDYAAARRAFVPR
jgi:hypothetical protein